MTRLLLAEIAPRLGDIEANLARIREVLSLERCDLAIFPELALTGYRLGDRFHALAFGSDGTPLEALAAMARERASAVVVGAPTRSPDRSGEIHNSVLLVRRDGTVAIQSKRYLPTYGPFEEGSLFTPVETSVPVPWDGHRLGLEICYDAFFPEVSRELALGGSELLVVVSAAPITSRRLFEKVLPARAVENAQPLVYVNRVGVEDGLVFGGGTAGWDARGEPLRTERLDLADALAEEAVLAVEVDLSEAARWRPFRPVLRDISVRPGRPRSSS